MAISAEILRLRVLLCFLKSAPENCTVMGIARTLKEDKHRVSRAIIALEGEGLVDRTDNRAPVLTPKGREAARRYSERADTALNHLLYEGVDIESAKQDSYIWALHNSEQTMDVIRSSEEQYRVKYALRDQPVISGTTLCKRLKDGLYQFPFVLYREAVKDNSNLSMANRGFEQPCNLYVDHGVGVIQLRVKAMMAQSQADGQMMFGRVRKMEYFDSGRYISAEFHGDVISFPADALTFYNMGTGMGQVLHGSACLRMQCSCGILHMPESTAIFTILI